MYADDLILLSPSLRSLQFMVDICSDYVIRHSLVFSCKKTLFTVVNKPKYAISDLTLDCHSIILNILVFTLLLVGICRLVSRL